jgi:hypothetical protein
MNDLIGWVKNTNCEDTLQINKISSVTSCNPKINMCKMEVLSWNNPLIAE